VLDVVVEGALEPDEVAELAGVAVVVVDVESDFGEADDSDFDGSDLEESDLDDSDLVPRLSVL
jgi:hypothetical protein